MFSRRKVSLSALQALLPLIAGPAILSFGLYNIHEPCGVTEGGVLGMTLLLQHWLGLSPSASGLVMNLASYLLGMRYLGRGFLKKSLVSAAAFSAFYALWERFPPLLPNLGAWPLAAAIAGALFVGVGVGMAGRAGAAPGGDDALAMVLAHGTKQPIGRMYLVCDVTVLALSLSYIPLFNILCSLASVTLSSWIIGRFTLPARGSLRPRAADA